MYRRGRRIEENEHDGSVGWQRRRRRGGRVIAGQGSVIDGVGRYLRNTPARSLSLSLSLVSVIHHLGLFFTYFICNIFRNFYSVNRPPPPPPRRLPSSSSEPVTPRLSGPARKTTSCLVVHPPAHKGVARGWQRDGERRRRNGRRMKKGAVSPRVSSRVRAWTGGAREVRGVTQAAALYMLKNLDMEIRPDSSPGRSV